MEGEIDRVAEAVVNMDVEAEVDAVVDIVAEEKLDDVVDTIVVDAEEIVTTNEEVDIVEEKEDVEVLSVKVIVGEGIIVNIVGYRIVEKWGVNEDVVVGVGLFAAVK